MPIIASLATILALQLYLAKPSMAQTDTSAAQKPVSEEQFVSIDFNNVDINVFIKFMSELTGTNFVVDQRVKGKVTIISPSKISLKEAYRVFESVLEVHGYTTVTAGDNHCIGGLIGQDHAAFGYHGREQALDINRIGVF